jgi:hypothetical protein
MKKTILCLLIFSAMNVSAQKIKTGDVPAQVIKGFKMHFSGVKVKSWEKEKNDLYEAEFLVNKKETSAVFNQEGVLIETETEISIKDLPGAISDYVLRQYAAYKISEASQIIAASGLQTFEVELEKGKEEFDLLFSTEGNFLRKSVEAVVEDEEKNK